ncbi:hypothetical protein VKS41_009162 [Umbelopsis sp. WA50703]
MADNAQQSPQDAEAGQPKTKNQIKNEEKKKEKLAKLAAKQAKLAAAAAQAGDSSEKKKAKKPKAEKEAAPVVETYVNKTPKGEKKDMSEEMAANYNPVLFRANRLVLCGF